MPYIQRTVFGLLLLVPQFWSVMLPERRTSAPVIPRIIPPRLQDWSYPYPNTTKCKFPYIWQPSVDRCCYPVFNCESGYGIEFCSVDWGKDLCVKCKNSFKQYHLVHSFDGINAACFNVSKSDEIKCDTEFKKGILIPARGNLYPSCGLQCKCNLNSCYYGINPCMCEKRNSNCTSNQQMNRLTGECEACPWYGFKLKEDCDACLVNETLWMSGPTPDVIVPPTPNVTVPQTPNVTVPRTPNVTVPPTPNVTVPRTPNVTVWVTTIEGNLTKIITEETINKTTTALLPEIANDTTIRWVMIIGGVVGLFIAGMALMYLFQKRTLCKRSGASSSQYTSISQVPPIPVANPGPTTEFQEVSETSDLINNIYETNIQQFNGYIIGQPVSDNNNYLVNHKVEDHMDSPKSLESGNHLGIHGRINERNQSVSSYNESPENLTESGEGTHQIDDSDHTSQFISCPPVEKGQSWRFSRDSVADNDSLTVAKTLSGYENVAQNTVPQAICTRDVDRTNDNTNIIPVKEFTRIHPLNSRGTRGPDLKTLNHEGGICCEDSKIPNEDPRVPSEESPHASPQYLTMPCSPTTASNRSTFRPFLNRLISCPTDRPIVIVPPMRQEPQNQRQDGVTSTDTSVTFSMIHILGSALSNDESLESSIPSLNSCCEDNPPSYSNITNSPNTASHTLGGTEPKRPGYLRSATKNGSQIQKMVNQSRGGPDGASLPSDYQQNRVREPWHEVFETEVKVHVQSEETDPKTLLSSTQVRDRINVEIRTDSVSEDDPEKIVLKVILAEDTEKQIQNSYEDFASPDLPLNEAENNSDEVQGNPLGNDIFAIGANASKNEIDLRNVSLHNGNQILYNKWAFSSEVEHEENKLNSAAKSKLDTEETCHSYHSLQDKENAKKKTKSLDNGGNDDGFRDSKSSMEEIVKEADDFFSDTDPDVEESSSDQRSSHSDDEGVCSNGDAELNRELQQPSQGQIDVHNEFNSSSLSVNSEESGIDNEEQTFQNLQDF